MATIYLIRHGQASFGAANYDQLSELGRRQAQVLGEYLRDCRIALDAVYSGDLSRQQETARITIQSQPGPVPHLIDHRFNEIANDDHLRFLLPEITRVDSELKELVDRGLTASKDYQKAIEASFRYWVSPQCSDPRVQSWADYSAAVREALTDVMRAQGSGKSIGIFTSGGTVATIVAQVLGLDGDQTYQFYEPVFNCSVTQLFYTRDRVSLSYFNDCSYLRMTGARRAEQLVSYR